MIHRFARPVPEIRMITNSDESYIFETWLSLMEQSDQFFWPGQHQRIAYNGHKRVHSLNFQSVAHYCLLEICMSLLVSYVH